MPSMRPSCARRLDQLQLGNAVPLGKIAKQNFTWTFVSIIVLATATAVIAAYRAAVQR
jgi:hypothetical protein